MKTIFDHYASVEQLYGAVTAPVCEKHGLTYMEFTVVMFLANNPVYDTASQIVKIRRLAKSHVSVSIRSLLERGLLEGAYKGSDRRSIHLSLTQAAAAIVDDGRQAQIAFWNILMNGFSPEEQTMLQRFNQRIDENVDAYNQSQRNERCRKT